MEDTNLMPREDVIRDFYRPGMGRLRVYNLTEEPWFDARDVAHIMHYTKWHGMLSRNLPPEYYRYLYARKTETGRSGMICERGLFLLIEEAPRSKRRIGWLLEEWVSEILEELRKERQKGLAGVFSSEEFGTVNVEMIDDEPWFVAKDVCKALGYYDGRKAVADHVEDEDKGVSKRNTLGGIQDVTIINEAGLYSLIMSSKLTEAKRFKRWVTHEVLPSIRKQGVYMTRQALEKALVDRNTFCDLMLDRFLQQEVEISKLREAVARKPKKKAYTERAGN